MKFERVAVGSLNPVKLNAVKTVIGKVWPDAVVIGISAASEIGDQPRTDAEAIRGAINRATNALTAAGADLGIGLEGSVAETPPYGMLLNGWVAAVARDGRKGLGGGGGLLLPDKVAVKVRSGGEIGPIMDELLGESDTKKKQGAVGVLTGGLVSRREAFERMVIYALTPFLVPGIYAK